MNSRKNTITILERVRERKSRLDDRGKTTAVFPIVKEIIEQAIQDMPEDAKLPPIRKIAETLGITPVPTQRAINEMVEEGKLYVKFKSGIFVRSSSLEERHIVSTANQPAINEFHEQITFAIESIEDYQQEFWKNLAVAFNKSIPNCHLILSPFHPQTPPPNHFDLLEVTQWRNPNENWDGQFLDLKDLGLKAPDRIWDFQNAPYWVPLFYRTHFLFYNKDFLDTHHIPKPAYKDIEGQEAYYQTISTAAKTIGFPEKPYMTYYPITLFGKAFKWFHQCLFPNANQTINANRLKTALGHLIRFYKNTRDYQTPPDSPPQGVLREFIDGVNPFYWGSSTDAWRFEALRLNFDWRVYPCLNIDEQFHLSPVFGAVRGDSKKPVECIRFIEFILTDSVQRECVKTGVFSSTLTDIAPPRFEGDITWISEKLPQATPIDYKQDFSLYVGKNIVNTEFWRALLGETTWQEALENSFRYAKFYIQNQKNDS